MGIWLNIIRTVQKKSLNMHNNLAIFYCGTNGAGKSTLRSFNQDKVEIVIDSDNIAMESTLSGKSILNRMKQAKEKGFYTRLNYIGVDKVSINLDRVKARVKAGGHFIDEQTIRQRFGISRKNLLTALSFCDEVLIYDNSAEIPEVVFHIENNQITQIANNLVGWCENLRDELVGLGFRIT